MEQINEEQLKKKLSFDQYGRYALIRDIINNSRKSGVSYKILDVGGRGNLLRQFLPLDNVYFLDPLVDSDDENFIQGDGCNMPLDTNSFDWVTSADVFEHIPQNKRGDFLKEGIRVSKIGVVLAAPFYSDDVALAEINVNNAYKELSGGVDYIWLKEHIENGLPREDFVENYLNAHKHNFQKISNNDLFLWQFLINITLNVTDVNRNQKNIQENFIELNRFYNEKVYPFDFSTPSYRKIFYIQKTEHALDFKVDSKKIDTKNIAEIFLRGFSILNKLDQGKRQEIQQKDQEIFKANQIVQQKDQEIQQKDSEISKINQIVQQKDQEMNFMRSSKFWKLRELNFKFKFLIFHPVLFFRKYIKELERWRREIQVSLRQDGLKNTILRSANYIRYGKGVLSKEELILRRSVFEDADYIGNDQKIKEAVSKIDDFIGIGKSKKEVIMLVSHDASGTGAPILTLNIARVLKEELNKEVIIFLIQGGILEKDFSQYGLVINLNQISNKYIEDNTLLDSVCGKLRDYGVNKAIVSTVVSGIVIPTLESNDFKCISLIHELSGLVEKHGYLDALKYTLESNSVIVFPTQYSKNNYEEIFGLGESKVVIRPQGLYTKNALCDDIEQSRKALRKKLGLQDTDKIILGCGYAEHRKGIDLFFDVAKKTFEKNKSKNDIYFVWLGEKDKKFFKSMESVSGETDYQKNVKFIGFQKDASEYSLFHAGSDIFLLTSREDPFPSVVLDSMKCGIPVIAFEGGGGIPEILSDNCGVVVPYIDTEAMTHEIFSLLSNKKRYAGISLSAKERMRSSKYDFKSYVEYLTQLLSRKYFRIRTEHKNELTVSVIVPNYNYEEYLEERIQSIINQTVRPMEIVFLDDNSTDKSVLLAEKILAKSNIPYTIARNDSNKGCFSQWAKGIKMAKGDLVWIAEADDSCDPEFLEVLVDKFLDPEVGLAYAQSVRMNALGVKDDTYLPYLESIPRAGTHWRKDYINSGVDEVCRYLSIKNTIVNASAVLMRRDLLLQIGDEIGGGFSQAGDWFTYVKLLRNSKIAFSASILNYHRYHQKNIVSRSGSGSDTQERAKQLILETLDIQNFIISNFPVSRKQAYFSLDHVRSVCRNSLGKELESSPDCTEKIKAYEKAVQLLPKRICFFSTNDGWGGSEVACAQLARSFAQEGWIVSLVMNSHGPRPLILEKIISEGSVSFFERTSQDYCQSFETSAFVLGFDPEIIFISQGHVFEAAKLMIWCKEKGIKYTNFIPLVTEHHLSIMNPNNESIKENATFLSQSKRVFSDNAHAKDVLQKIFNTPFDNFEVIRNGYDVKYHQNFVWNEPKDSLFQLAFLGRLEKVHKGVDLLLEVMSMDKWKKRPLKILVYGHGPYEEYMKQKIESNKLEHLVLCGHTDNIEQAILQAHGVIFPSRMEGLPISLVDALLCSRMAIVTPVGGMPEVVFDGKNGFVAVAPTLSDIDACLERAWQRRDEWKVLGKNAGIMIREIIPEFPQKQCIETMHNILEEKL